MKINCIFALFFLTFSIVYTEVMRVRVVRWINDILFRTSSRNVVEKESCISKETATLLSSRDPVGPGSG